jgi:hypothetical protein
MAKSTPATSGAPRTLRGSGTETRGGGEVVQVFTSFKSGYLILSGRHAASNSISFVVPGSSRAEVFSSR